MRFGLAGTSAFLAAALAALALLLSVPSMLRWSASIRLTTLTGRSGAFSLGAGRPALPARTTQRLSFLVPPIWGRLWLSSSANGRYLLTLVVLRSFTLSSRSLKRHCVIACQRA